MKPDISNRMKDILIDYYNDFERPAQIYSGLTALCLVIDIISTIVYISKVGINDDKPDAQIVHLG